MRSFFIISSLCITLLLCLAGNTQAQLSPPFFGWGVEPCHSNTIHQHLMATDSVYEDGYRHALNAIENIIASDPPGLRSGTVYTIPVVVHIIHTGEALGHLYNPTDAQITDLIDYLNDAFRNVAPYATAGGVDTEIEFALAQRDPSCSPTNGIIRVNGNSLAAYNADGVASPSGSGPGASDPDVKALSVWPNSDYYNIWIVKKINGNDGTSGSFTAGYAYFPGASSAIDGTIMLASQISPGDITITHELGHAFNLYHTFQGSSGSGACPTDTDCTSDGDRVCDTDPHDANHFQCTTNPCGGTGVLTNFMSYSGCQDKFTTGQKTRMRAALTGPRSGLLSSLGAVPPPATLPTAACTPTFTGSHSAMGVTLVDLNTLNFSSSSSSFDGTNYLDNICNQGTDVDAGSTHTLTVETSINTHAVRAYIDFNNDGDFTDAGEEIFSSNTTSIAGTHTATGAIVFPSTGILFDQPLRLRVCSSFLGDGAPTSCSVFRGQAEDFSLTVNSPSVIADFSANITSVCSGSSVIFTDGSTGATSWSWNFGAGASPATATGAGPHTVTYTGSGTSTVSLNVNSGADIETKTNYITVNTVPAAPTASNITDCAGSVTANLTATGTGIQWYSDAGLTAMVGTGASYTHGHTAAGTYTYYATQTVSGCESPAVTVTLTVNASPSAPTASNITDCVGSVTANLTATGTGIQWYSDAGLTTMVGTGVSYTHGHTASGTYTYYATQTVSGCESPATTVTLTINAIPAAPAASNITDCVGSVTANLTATGTGIQWYSDTGLTTMVGTGASYTHGHTAAGTYTYYATQTVSGCESPSTTVTLTVNTCATPTADFSGTPTTICAGESVTFTDASALATSWNWNFGAGASPAAAVGVGPHVVTYSTSGSKTVSLSINGGADTETKANYITVNATPAAPAASNVTVCGGGTIPNLTGTGTSLQWYSDAALTTLEGTGASFAHGETAVGTYTYYVTQTVSGCESPSTTVTLTINATPAAPAASNVTACAGGAIPNLTATGTSLQWYSDAALSTLEGAGASFAHGETAAGTYTYYVTQTTSGCESSSTTVTLTISASPAAPAASNITDCTGSVTANLTATGTGIQWYSDAGLTTVVGTGTSYTHGHTTAGTYTYYATQTVSSCESPSTTVTLTINSCTPPNVSDFTRTTIEGTPIAFSPANFFAAYSDADGDPMTKVRIESLPTNGTLTFGGSPVVVGQEIPGASLGSLAYAPAAGYTGPDSFGWNGHDGTSYATASANVNITVLPTPPPPPGGGGSTVTLFAPGWISAVGQDTASVELTWRDNNAGETGYEIYRRKEGDSFFALVEVVGGGVEETVTYLDTEGLEPDTRYSYYVKPLSGTVVGPQSDVATDYTYPLMPDLVNVIKACQDGKGSIEVSGEHRSNKFKWYRTEDALSSEAVKNLDGSDFTDPVFETDVISSPRTYYVTSQGQRYESEPRLTVMVGIKPRPVAEILSDSTGIFSCDNSVLVQAQTQDSASYTWLRNGSEVGTTSVNEFTAVQSGKYTVLVEKDGCTTLSEEVTVSLNYEPFVEIDTRGPFCEGGLLRTSGESGLTYTWIFDSLVIGEGANQVIDSSGVYTLIAEKFGCQTTLEVDVTVNNFPAENTIAASSLSLCDGGDVTLTAPFAEGMAYRWFRDGGELGGSGQSIRATSEGTYSVTLTFPGGCEKTLEDLVLEEVSYQKPEITQDLNTLTLVLDSTATVDSVTWYRNSIVQPAFNGMTSIEATVDGTYWAYVQYSDGCEDLSETIRFIFEVTGTEDVREELGLVVYPNPFGSRLSIRTEKPIGSLELAVIDDLGRTVMTRSFESSAQRQTFELDMSRFASGLYTLRFTSDKGVFMQKVMKAE